MVRIKKIKYLLYGLVILHIGWWLFSVLLNQPTVPSPQAVYLHLPVVLSNDIGWHIYYSLFRLFWGLLLATVIGMGIGTLMGISAFWNQLLSPLLYLTYPIPKIAFLPVAMLLFGLGEMAKIVMLVLIVVFQLILSVRDGIKQIDQTLYNSLFVLGASRWRQYVDITLPASLISLVNTLRIALGTAIAVLFLTEVYGTEYGLGYFIMNSWYRMNYLNMYSGILVLSVVAFILFIVLEWIESKLSCWRS